MVSHQPRQRPSFGLKGSGGGDNPGIVDPEILQEEVSKTVGLLNIPTGVVQVLTMSFLYVRLSKRAGDLACTALSGVVLVTANPMFRPAELQYVCEQSQASALFVTRELRHPVRSLLMSLL